MADGLVMLALLVMSDRFDTSRDLNLVKVLLSATNNFIHICSVLNGMVLGMKLSFRLTMAVKLRHYCIT